MKKSVAARSGMGRSPGTLVPQISQAATSHTPSAISSVPAPNTRPRLRVAVISDIHGNAHALQAVLAAVDHEGPDGLVPRDTVGYGARPNECCSLVREAADICLAGNHDLLALGKEVLEADFNADAATASRWTRGALDEPSRSFIGALEPEAHLESRSSSMPSSRSRVGVRAGRGVGAGDARADEAPLVLVGHSHVPSPSPSRTVSSRAATRPPRPRSTSHPVAGSATPARSGSHGTATGARAWLLLDLAAGRRVVQARRVRRAGDAGGDSRGGPPRPRSPSGSRTGSSRRVRGGGVGVFVAPRGRR